MTLRPVQYKILAAVLLIAAGAAVYTVFDPALSEWFPKCPFHMLTGLDCPGCGSQRAIHSILTGHIAEAFRYNALLVIAIPYIMLLIFLKGAAYFCPTDRKRLPAILGRIEDTLYHGRAVHAVIAIILIFWAGRNLIYFL